MHLTTDCVQLYSRIVFCSITIYVPRSCHAAFSNLPHKLIIMVDWSLQVWSAYLNDPQDESIWGIEVVQSVCTVNSSSTIFNDF
jgi:hypothetical protein